MDGEQSENEAGQATRERILDGALYVIGNDGIRSLSMRKIAEAAGVSRGTVYHYFNNTGEVLQSVSSYDQRRFDEGATRVLSGARTPDQQFRAFLDYCYRYLTLHPTRWMVEHEPLFLLRYLDEQMPYMRARLEKSLASILANAPAVRTGRLTPHKLADLTVRMLVSAYLLPAGDPRSPLDSIAELILANLDSPPKGSTPSSRPGTSKKARKPVQKKPARGAQKSQGRAGVRRQRSA